MRQLRNWVARDGRALLLLRLLIGFGFFAHGWAKLARGPDGFAAIVAAMGLPFPLAEAWMVILLELVGGLLLMAGAFVLPLSAPLAAILLVAALGVHGRYGFSSTRLKSFSAAGAEFGPVGYELDLLYLAGLAALAFSGTTPLSVDRFLERRR